MRTVFPLLILLLTIGCAANTGPLNAADVGAIRETLADYRQAWLDGDRTAVLDHLSDEIVLYKPGPTSGRIDGKEAVREFWFPDTGVSYPVLAYKITGEEIFGSGEIANVLGRSELTWETVENGQVIERSTSLSDFITVMRKEDGRWRIYRQMYQMRN